MVLIKIMKVFQIFYGFDFDFDLYYFKEFYGFVKYVCCVFLMVRYSKFLLCTIHFLNNFYSIAIYDKIMLYKAIIQSRFGLS